MAFSGRLIDPETLIEDVKSKPGISWSTVIRMKLCSPSSLSEAAVGLEKAGFKEVFAHVMKGTGHGIAPDGLSVALAFMRDKLNF